MDKALPHPLWTQRDTAVEPPGVRRREPVFIHDCVTPLGGTTLLGLMLQRDLEKLGED